MRLIFAGTPVFAREALAALIAAGHEIALVLTRADKPAGRGQKISPSPVKRLALDHGLPVFQPASLRDEAALRVLVEAHAQVMVVAAYGLILPAAALAVPPLGCLNIHGSLLPRWRGAAPIQRAIEAGDSVTGITIMQMDAGLDTGPMLLSESLAIGPSEAAAALHDRLADLGARLIVRALDELAAARLRPEPQPQTGITYAHKILKTQSRIDWRASAREIADRIRAFDPFPGCTADFRATPAGGEPERLKIWAARPLEGAPPGPGAAGAGLPGAIAPDAPGRLVVGCGSGLLEVLEVQRPGGRRLPVADWLRAVAPAPGAAFVPNPPDDEPSV
jgi:methionyl-tRNA formyltransferase